MSEEPSSPVNVANLRNSLFGGANGINVLNLTPGRKPSFKRSKENIESQENNNAQKNEGVATPMIKVMDTEKRPSLRKKKKTENDIVEERSSNEQPISTLVNDTFEENALINSTREDSAQTNNKKETDDVLVNNTPDITIAEYDDAPTKETDKMVDGVTQLEVDSKILPSMCKGRVKRQQKRPPSRSFVRKSYNMVDDLEDQTQKPCKDDVSIVSGANGANQADSVNENTDEKRTEKIKLSETEKEKEVEKLLEDLKSIKPGPEINVEKEETDLEEIMKKMKVKETVEKERPEMTVNKNNNDINIKEKSNIDFDLKKELSEGLYMDKASLRAKRFPNDNAERRIHTKSHDTPRKVSKQDQHETSFTSRFREHFWPRHSDNDSSPDRSPRFTDKFLRKNKSKETEEIKKPSLSSRLTSWTRR